ncbi:MAG: PorT family protein [Crocinitomicaceae bacterium]|nr:PorT family protein [Crocinitomicaceae bacterium]
MNFLKVVAVIVFVFISANLYAQEETKPKTSRLSIGLSYDPSIGHRYLKTDSQFEWMKAIYDSIENPTYNFSTGLNVKFEMSKRFGFSSGVLFSRKGSKIAGNRDLNTAEIYSNYYFLSVPVKFNYNIIANSNTLYITGGVINDFLVNSNQVHSNNEYTVVTKFKTNESLTTYNIAAIGGLGMDLRITDKSYFKMEAFYQQSLNSLTTTNLKRYLYSFGSKVGVYVRF